MPAKPLIQSPRLRRAIIALIMAAILALSLLAAAAFSGSHGIRRAEIAFGALASVSVGTLDAAAPGTWTRSNLDTPDAARFTSPDGETQLTIARLSFDDAVNLFDALNAALDTFDLTPTGTMLQIADKPEPMRSGIWTGLRIMGVTDAGRGRSIHHAVIMTENARRFWVIHLVQQSASSLYEGISLVQKVSTTAIDRGRRDATTQDLAAAGLSWTHSGDGWVLRVDADHVAGEAIDMIAMRGRETKVMRAAGSITPPDGAPDEATMLADYFEGRLNRPPTDDERMALSLAAGPRVTLVRTVTKTLEHSGFTWAQGFMTFDDGALTVQLICPQGSDQALRDMLEAAAASLHPTWGDTLDAAGARAVTTLTELTRTRTAAAANHYELLRGDKPAGFGFERIAESADAFAWQGEALLVTTNALGGPTVFRWRSDEAAERFSFIQLQDGGSSGYHLERNGEKLSLKVVTSNRAEPAWVAAVSPRYVPSLLLEYWPAPDAQTSWRGEPALVDFADMRDNPRPHILQRGGDAPIILLRSLIAVDADRMTLDETGKVAAHGFPPMHRPGEMTHRLMLRKVEPEDLAQRYPQMRSIIEKWSAAAPTETP